MYSELTEQEKESDRKEIRQYLPLLFSILDQALADDRKEWIRKYENSIGNTRKLIDEALAEQREEIRKSVERIKLDMDVVVCDCGEPYKAKWELIVRKAVEEAKQQGREKLLKELGLKRKLYGKVDYEDNKNNEKID